MKKNDIVALMLYNPESTYFDWVDSGISVENTEIKDEKDYLDIDAVKNNPMFQDDGVFNQDKFHNFYNNALQSYNILAAGWQPSFDENNIFAPRNQRRKEPNFQEIHIMNPFRQTQSLTKIGELGQRTKSMEEIAQSNKVLDVATGKWLDSPEDSFFGTVIGAGPLVLATWDFDADENGNPTTTDIKYKKGTPKYNEDGEFYYETLNGRSSYGKQLLHIGDAITREDSSWHKLDFLDSDDIQKSLGGTIVKNIALIGSMFISPYIVGATVLQQGLKLGATFGKLFAGSDSSFLNNLQAIASTTDLHESKSEFAKDPENMWAPENWVNLIGDVIAQLKQQRWIFEQVPRLYGNAGLFEKGGQEKLIQNLTRKYELEEVGKIAKNGINSETFNKVIREAQLAANSQATIDAEKIINTLSRKSGDLSMMYMTGITVNDMYDEAKDAGLSDIGASALTLGYAAAEYWLLSKGLGELVLPELRASKARARGIVSSLSKPTVEQANQAINSAATKEEKQAIFKSLFNKGKQLFMDYRNGGFPTAAGNMAAASLGEGVEEVSEEFLADAFRGIHDLGKWLGDWDDQKDMFQTKGLFDRYMMNFVGGLIGGGINSASMDFSSLMKYNNMTQQEAMKEALYMKRNGQGNELFEAIDKGNFGGNKHLSFNTTIDNNGNRIYEAGTEDNNQEKTIKDMLRVQLQSMFDAVDAHSANISDESLIKNQDLIDEIKFRYLANTSSVARFQEVFASHVTDLVNAVMKRNELAKSIPDSDSSKKEQLEKELKVLDDEIKNQESIIQDMKDGKYAADVTATALFEIHTGLNTPFIDGATFETFVKRHAPEFKNTPLEDVDITKLDEDTRNTYLNMYKDYIAGIKKDDVLQGYDSYRYLVNKAAKGTFFKSLQDYTNQVQQYTNIVNQLLDRFSTVEKSKKIDSANQIFNQLSPAIQNAEFQEKINALLEQEQTELNTVTEDQDKANISNKYNILRNIEYENFILDELPNYIKSNAKYIHPVTKQQLQYLQQLANNNANLYDGILSGEIEDVGDIAQYGLLYGQDPELFVEAYADNKLNQYGNLSTAIQEVLDNTQDTPILELLDNFALDVTGKNPNLSTLFANGDSIINQTRNINGLAEASKVDFSSIDQSIDQALRLINMMNSVMLGARTDSAELFQQNQDLTTGDVRFDTSFGLNYLINQLYEKSKGDTKPEPLPTIDGQTADAIIADLDLLAKNLRFWKELHNINTGQKLNSQPRITLRTNQVLYKALKTLNDVAPEDFDKSSLSEFFDDNNILNLNKDAEDVSSIVLENMEKERIRLEDAIFDVANTQGISKLFNVKALHELFTNNEILLNENTQALDPHLLFSYLASRAALKSSTWYNTYRKNIKQEIAPIAPQELGMYLHTANLLNGQVLSNSIATLRDSMIKYLEEITPEQRKALLKQVMNNDKTAELYASEEFKPFLKNLEFIPKYDNITMVEGVAGSGKTTAVMKLTVDMTKAINPDLYKHAFVVDMTSSRAEKLAKNLGLENSEHFDKKSFLQRISNWVEPTKKGKNFEFVEGKDFIVTKDGFIKSNYNVIPDVNPASTIIIDEVGRFTDLELQTIDDYAKAHNIAVLTFGDLSQSKITGIINVKVPGLSQVASKLGINLTNDLIPLNIQISRNSILHTPKNGISFRTRNLQQDVNQNMMQAAMIENNDNLNFHYYQENGKLFGTKMIFPAEENWLEKAMIEVDNIMNVLNADEKLGVIYQDINSPLLKAIKDKYPNRIVEFEGTSVQGEETRYSIMEAPQSDSQEDFKRDIYTAVTRAQDGTILVSNGKYKNITLSQTQDDFTKLQELQPEQIENYSNSKKEMYNRIFGDNTEILTYTPRTSQSTITPEVNTKFPVVENASVQVDEDTNTLVADFSQEPIDLSGTVWMQGSRPSDSVVKITSDANGANVQITFGDGTTIEYNGNLVDLIDNYIPPELEVVSLLSEGTVEQVADIAETNEKLLPEPKIITPSYNAAQTSIKVENDPLKVLFFTTAALETGGWIRQDDGKAIPIQGNMQDIAGNPRHFYRIDSMNGLNKILKDTSYDKMLDILMKLHRAILSTKDRAELNNRIFNILKNEVKDDIKQTTFETEFGLWRSSLKGTTAVDSKGNPSQFLVYEKTEEEKSEFNDEIVLDTHQNISGNNLSIVISYNGDKKLMLPIAFFSSPITLMQLKQGDEYIYPEVYAIWKQVEQEQDAFNKLTVRVLQDQKIKNKYPALYNLFKLYRFDHNGFFHFESENANERTFTPINDLTNYGPQIDKTRGKKQIIADFRQKSKQLTSVLDLFKNKQLQFSSEPYVILSDQIQLSDGTIKEIYSGQLFTLVGSGYYLDDEAMQQAWLDGDPNVKIQYLVEPIITFDEYAQSLKDFDDGKIARPIGDNTTAFHILNIIKENNQDFLRNTLLANGISEQEVGALLNALEQLDQQYKADKKDPNLKIPFVNFISRISSKSDEFLPQQDTLQHKLFKVLRILTYPIGEQSFNGLNTENQVDLEKSAKNIKTISDILDNQEFLIFDKSRIDKNSTGLFKKIVHDQNSPYTISGRPFLTTARVTTNAFGTIDSKFNEFIDKVVNELIFNNSGENGVIDNIQVSAKEHERFIGKKLASSVYTPSKIYENLLSLYKTLKFTPTKEQLNPVDQSAEKNSMETIINIINNAYNNVLITPDGTVYQNDDILNLKSETEENIFDLVNNSAKFGNTEYAVEESDDKSKLTFVEKTTQTSPQVDLNMSVEDFVATLSSDVQNKIANAKRGPYSIISKAMQNGYTLQQLLDEKPGIQDILNIEDTQQQNCTTIIIGRIV